MNFKWIFCVIFILPKINCEYNNDYDEDSEYDDESIETLARKRTINSHVNCNIMRSFVRSEKLRWNYKANVICHKVSSTKMGLFLHFIDKQSSTVDVMYTDSQIEAVRSGTFEGASHIEKMYFENSSIDVIESSAFLGLTNLQILSLRGTHLKIIDSDMFNGLQNLQQLVLTGNHLTGTLKPNTFSNLISLRKLNLENNLISTLDAFMFQNLEKLTHLSLGNNLLTSLDSKLFLFANKISQLLLFNNNIIEIEDDTFVNVPEVLDLSFNNLTSVSFGMFGNKSEIAIKHLNISNNNIRSLSNSFVESIRSHQMKHLTLQHNYLEEFSNMSPSSNIDVSYNNIQKISNIDFRFGSESFDVSHNALVEFDHLQGPFLKNLCMNHNKLAGRIVAGKFTEFGKLETLLLDYNNISELSNGSFSGLGNLKVLNISFNAISNINGEVFRPLPNLKVLLMNGNLLKTLDVLLLRVYLPSLTTIGISHNQWSCDILNNVLNNLTSVGVEIVHYTNIHRSNVHVIQCSSNVPVLPGNSSLEQKTFPKLDQFVKKHMEEMLSTTALNQNVSDLETTSLKIRRGNGEAKNVTQNDDISNKSIDSIFKQILELRVCIIILLVILCLGILLGVYRFYRKRNASQDISLIPYRQTMEVDEL